MAGLFEQIRKLPRLHDRAAAERAFAELRATASGSDELKPLSELIERGDAACDLLLRIFSASPYLTGLCLRDPIGLRDCLLSEPDRYRAELAETMAAQVAATRSSEEAMRALRVFKRRIALLIGLLDIGCDWPVDRVTEALSDAADAAVVASVRFLMARAARAGNFTPADPEAPEADSGYFVLGLGKLGGRELNYSSDIDLIVFYDTERWQARGGREPGPFFVRLTRDLVRMLQERTADGYVFRVDLRLRPDPGATQIALSTEAGLTYYESFGQNWERAALIKARVVGGDQRAGEEFLSQLAPFIWRRYLDFAAIADIHAMKRRVHEFKGHARIAVAGHNIKLGRGGIREIEFFAQTQQLIAGGRQNDLRGRKTVETLNKLAEKGWIDRNTAQDMAEAYRFLRYVEHRLQMIADEQTHTLPERGEELERLAHFCGFADAEAFAAALVARLQRVQSHYEDLFERVPEPPEAAEGLAFRGGDEEDPATLEALSRMGFGNPANVVAAVRAWRSGRYAATRSQRARERLTEFLPVLLEALASTAQPDAALASFDRFLAELPAGVQLFSLLSANPELLRLIANIMGTAPRLAHVLSRRPRILDAVLDPGFFGALPSPETLEATIARETAAAADHQDFLDRIRRVGQEQRFLIGAWVLSGTITADQAGGAYAALAQGLIAALQTQVETELARVHGRLEGGRAAVLAMGKLGGREMTAGSDLDLIIIYDFAGDQAASDGAKPLAGNQYYARFTQRLITAISSPTAEGKLYDVDMRLRPSGHQGPVATRFSSFVDYQQTKAWTWEHLALTRGRLVSGPADFCRTIESAIAEILSVPRERAQVAEDVQAMRDKIAKANKGSHAIWDIKLARGGLVDIEFIAQFLQLISAHEHPQVLDQNTGAALRKLAEAGLLAKADADILMPADRLYQNLTQILRLCLDRPFDPAEAPEGLRALLIRATGEPDFATLEARLKDTLASVHQAFGRLIR